MCHQHIHIYLNHTATAENVYFSLQYRFIQTFVSELVFFAKSLSSLLLLEPGL